MFSQRISAKYKRRRYKSLLEQLQPKYFLFFFSFFAFVLFISFTLLPNTTRDSETNSNTISDITMEQKNEEPKNVEIDKMDDIKNDKIIVDNNGRIQIFYYPWYGNPENDGKYIHWNHDVLPHWQENENKKYPQIGTLYDPTNDEIGANYYPKLGTYSSSNIELIKTHFRQLLAINVTVLIVSWHSPEAIKNNPNKAFAEKDKITSKNLDLLFEIASNNNEFKNKIKISIHLEPYDDRSAESTYNDIKYINNRYGKSVALYRSVKHNNMPFYYCYDSYRMKDNEWKKLLIDKNNKYYIKNDGIFLGLYLNHDTSKSHILNSGFDGFYTYFAAKQFTDGSTPEKSWNMMAKWSLENNLLFVPSVGPGYDDTRIRPWNFRNKKQRDNGKYYQSFWNVISKINNNGDNNQVAIKYVSITSFNEWHEGTQIEESIKKTSKNGFIYSDFENEGGSDAYMKLTHQFGNQFISFVNKMEK